MNIQFSYKQVEEKDKKFLGNYLEKKKQRLATLLSDNEWANTRLEIRAEKFVKKDAFKVEIFLISPEHNFMSGEDDHTIIEAFDLALDKLIMQIRKEHEFARLRSKHAN